MKNKPARAININLVPQDPFFDTALGRILRWSLSAGRYIVIFTELIVIISFASRFSLDRQVTDLNGAINQKQAIVESYGDLESKFRLIQNKIEQYAQVEQQGNVAELFPRLSQIVPRDVKLESLIIKNTQVNLTGAAASQMSLNTLITNLQLSPGFYNVTIDKIETSQEKNSFLSFRLRFETKDTTKK